MNVCAIFFCSLSLSLSHSFSSLIAYRIRLQRIEMSSLYRYECIVKNLAVSDVRCPHEIVQIRIFVSAVIGGRMGGGSVD